MSVAADMLHEVHISPATQLLVSRTPNNCCCCCCWCCCLAKCRKGRIHSAVCYCFCTLRLVRQGSRQNVYTPRSACRSSVLASSAAMHAGITSQSVKTQLTLAFDVLLGEGCIAHLNSSLSFGTSDPSGIRAHSCFYESLHKVPLTCKHIAYIANLTKCLHVSQPTTTWPATPDVRAAALLMSVMCSWNALRAATAASSVLEAI